ncbi:unnamed protein product, partial [Candidula unifasciata]
FQGQPCSADLECAVSLNCTNNNTCDCLGDFYYDSTNYSCVQKKNKGDNCGADIECTPNLTCLSHICDCSEGFYYNSSFCVSKSNLNIVVRTTARETRSIVFSWTDVSQRSDVNYTISWDVSNTMVATRSGVTVVGLVPGTSYSFTVVTSLPADGNYPLIQVHQTPVTAWTRPDTPGPVNGPRRIDNSTYEVTFGRSTGSVSQYTMTVRSGSVEETQSSTSISMRFTKLRPATTYSYSLWSFNGNSDTSVPVNGSFTTDPEASGPVDGLSPAGVQSHTANVTWQTPQDPRGNITGYLVQVALQDSTECFFFQIPCHGCPTNVSAPSCTLRSANISGSGNVYNLELLNLKPYRNYTVKVQAVNERGLGESTSLTFQTQISAANDIIDLTVYSVRNVTTPTVDLYVSWTPGEKTGPTVYYILVQEALGLDTGDYNQSVSPLTVSGYNNNNYMQVDALAYWNYNVSVWAHTDEGNSSLKSALNKTVENDPGPVENLNVTQDPTIANIVTLTFECPEIRSRNGRIDKFVINQTLLNSQAQEVNTGCQVYQYRTATGCQVYQYRTYWLPSLSVQDRYWLPNYITSRIMLSFFSLFPRPEKLKELLRVDALVKQPDTSTEQTKITTVVCSSCLTDARWGIVRNVGLLVCVKSHPNCTQPGRKKRSTALQFGQFPSWATAKQQGFTTGYRTTPDKWIPPISGNEQFNKFVVGENTSCNAADLTDYCNGPLPAGTEFYISVIMCTTAGCTVYPETSIFKTSPPDDESSYIGAIVGGVLGGLALVAVIG